MARARGGESRQGLVITLVFFILATIGLGVGTYFGFSEQDTYRAQKDKAVKDADERTRERDWYRFQANLYRAYLGQTQGVDLTELALNKDKFDTGGLTGKEKDEV